MRSSLTPSQPVRFSLTPSQLVRFSLTPSQLVRFSLTPSQLVRFSLMPSQLVRFSLTRSQLVRFSLTPSQPVQFSLMPSQLVWFSLMPSQSVRFSLMPSHEIADQLSKKEGKKEQSPSQLSYREVKTLIRNNKKRKAIFHRKTGGYNPNQDALHQLPRHQQTTIFRLRTGSCRSTEQPSKENWRKDLRSMPLWRGEPNTKTLHTVLLTPPASKAADTANF